MPAVPALRHAVVRRADDRRDAALRPGARGARLAAPARRRQELPRARGGRDAAHRARRDRVAGRRAVGVRHAARRAVRVRRRRAARLPRPRQTFHPFRALDPTSGRPTSGRRAAASVRSAVVLRGGRGAPAAAGSAPPPQPASGGGDDRGAARRVARARDLRAASVGRAGARQRPVRRRAGAPVRGGRRAVVPRLRRAAARRGRGDARRRGADPRGGERRRPADDRAQGQGPRVPGRRAGRHRRRAVAQHRVAAGWTATGRAAPSAWPAGRPRSCGSTTPIEVARDEAEGVRVAYVAATRARDLLVVCAVGDRPWDAGG